MGTAHTQIGCRLALSQKRTPREARVTYAGILGRNSRPTQIETALTDVLPENTILNVSCICLN